MLKVENTVFKTFESGTRKGHFFWHSVKQIFTIQASICVDSIRRCGGRMMMFGRRGWGWRPQIVLIVLFLHKYHRYVRWDCKIKTKNWFTKSHMILRIFIFCYGIRIYKNRSFFFNLLYLYTQYLFQIIKKRFTQISDCKNLIDWCLIKETFPRKEWRISLLEAMRWRDGWR